VRSPHVENVYPAAITCHQTFRTASARFDEQELMSGSEWQTIGEEKVVWGVPYRRGDHGTFVTGPLKAGRTYPIGVSVTGCGVPSTWRDVLVLKAGGKTYHATSPSSHLPC
jgi:hypothetical protein